MTGRLTTLHAEFQAGRAKAGTDLLNLLGSWWVTPIATHDTSLAEFIRRREGAAA